MLKKICCSTVCVCIACGLLTNGVASDYYLSLTRSALTLTGYDTEIRQLPVSASVVTEADIKMTNAKQTTDILGQLPGVFISKTSAYGRADVNIRGIGDSGRQIGVFIDGRPDKMGIFGCSVTHALPMNNVDRIEVIRGPEAVLYGSEAFGGVVNIITKRAKKPFELNVLSSYGTFNSQMYRIQQGSKFEKLDYFISANKSSSDGHMDNASYDARDFTGQVGYAVNGHGDLSLSGKYFSGTKFEPLPSAAGTWNDYNRGSVDMTYKQTLGLFESSLKVYRSFGKHQFSDGFDSEDFTNGAMLHGYIPLAYNNELSAGIVYRYQSGTILNTAPARLIGTYSKYEYGIYLNDKYTFFERLSVDAGARYNYDEFAKEAVTPRIGAVYNVTDQTILRTVWSRGFRAPQINDLFLWAGNRNLKPEKVTNTEAGIRQSFYDRMYVDVGIFSMKGKDLIEVRSGKKINIGEFTSKGIETACNVVLSSSFYGRLNYTYLDSDQKTTGRPGNVMGASLQYKQKKLQMLLSGEYVSKYYAGDNSTQNIGNYGLLNTKINYQVHDNINLFAAVDNITDKKYFIYYDGLYRMPGSTTTMGLEYQF